MKTHDAVYHNYYVGELTLGRQVIYMLTFNVLLIASSYIQFPLPFSPVPVTAQTMAVLACGLFLGPLRGTFTVIVYLLEGSLGLPVFAGGSAGIAKLIGPTGGYLIGFAAAAFVVGLLSEKIQSMNYSKLLAVLTTGTVVIFIPGVSVVSLYAPEGQALVMGLYPFLPGAVAKIILTASSLAAYKKIRKSL
ncbi:MAG: biotin transporter BioY [candidate division Zixibacteria bacterium]